MKIKIAFALLIFCGGLYYGVTVFSGCPPTWQVVRGSFTVCPATPAEDRTWKIIWRDGHTSEKSNFAQGTCCWQVDCYPRLEEPRSFPIRLGEEWAETAYDRRCNGAECQNNGFRTETITHSCSHPPSCNQCEFSDSEDAAICLTNNLEDTGCCSNTEAAQCSINGGVWDANTCTCISPIVIDVLGNGFNLTDAQNGVLFDILNTGAPKQLAWTAADSDDAWLALDRNENGRIDKGRELFGSSAPQPELEAGESKNGFRALAVFDKPQKGGNGDGQIDVRDEIFADLKLWRDANHNGISETNELHRIEDSGIRVIELDYKESKKQDENGNWFRYRAKVSDAQGAQIGRWAWDVYLKVAE